MNRRIIPLIMCGGAGTRLWPASREVHPKQFLSLFGARSTFQDTLLRVSDADLFERPVIITNNAYRFMVLEQLAATLSPGIGTITGFEIDEPTNYSPDHVRRRRNAAVAGLARGSSQAVPVPVRDALDVPGYAVAGFRCCSVRTACHHHQQCLSLHVLEQLAEIGLEADVLLEPMRRDSGPAIAAGAAFAEKRDKDAIVLALAADHVVSDTPAFLAACREGLAAAEAGHIVTFGVQPERAATEYGYINPGEVISGKVRAVAKFVEKPDPATAAELCRGRLSLEQRQLHVPRRRTDG